MDKARVINVIEEDKRGYKAVQLGFGYIKNSKAVIIIYNWISHWIDTYPIEYGLQKQSIEYY